MVTENDISYEEHDKDNAVIASYEVITNTNEMIYLRRVLSDDSYVKITKNEINEYVSKFTQNYVKLETIPYARGMNIKDNWIR